MSRLAIAIAEYCDALRQIIERRLHEPAPAFKSPPPCAKNYVWTTHPKIETIAAEGYRRAHCDAARRG
jgi:hypothetical protein